MTNRWQVGHVSVTQVVESEMPTSPKFFFDDAPPDLVARHAWLKPHFANEQGRLMVSIHCFIIESMGRRIVVDTCVGNDKTRRNPVWHRLSGPFLAHMTEAGYAPDTIDTVLCTHLHVDHVGWNTRWDGARWVPTFVNARYLFARTEWDHWDRVSKAGGASAYEGEGEGPLEDVLGDSVRPIVDAGLADLVETDHRLTSEVWLEPTPGHTPGHVAVRIASDGVRAVITGDLMHHPIQCGEPDRIVRFDHDPELAKTTRRDFLAGCANERTLVFGTHFAQPTAGHVVAEGGAWRFEVL